MGIVLAVLSGCGAEEYERRLRESVELMKYYALLDEHVPGPAWRAPGIELRVPEQFKPLPAPQRDPEAEAAGAAPPPDTRQPQFLAGGTELPGLAGAWRAEVTGSASRPLPAYMYVLSNYDLWLQSETHEEAAAFFDNVVHRLSHGLQVPAPAEHQWDSNVVLPRSHGYVAEKAFLHAMLNPQPSIDDAPYDVSIYLHQAGDIRVAVLFLVPHGADFKIPAGDILELSLETLEVSPERPVPGSLGGQQGGGGGSHF